jgi:hypothetical protein
MADNKPAHAITVILWIIYWCLITPVGILTRRATRAALRLTPPRDRTSYWTAPAVADNDTPHNLHITRHA